MMASPNQSRRNPTDPLPAIPIRGILLDSYIIYAIDFIVTL